MKTRSLVFLLSCALLVACKSDPSDAPTDTDTDIDPDTESSTDLPPTRVDLQYGRAFNVALSMWLPDQSDESWCNDLKRSDMTDVFDEDENSVDCWVVGTGRDCLQFLTFQEDGTLSHEAVFVVQLPCGAEQPKYKWIGGWLPERRFEYQGYQGTQDRFDVDEQRWLMEHNDRDVRVQVGEHVFVMEP